MQRHPHYIRIIQARNIVVIVAMALAAVLLYAVAGIELGMTLMVVGAAGTLFLLAWNIIWVNTVLFRITQEEMKMAP